MSSNAGSRNEPGAGAGTAWAVATVEAQAARPRLGQVEIIVILVSSICYWYVFATFCFFSSTWGSLFCVL